MASCALRGSPRAAARPCMLHNAPGGGPGPGCKASAGRDLGWHGMNAGSTCCPHAGQSGQSWGALGVGWGVPLAGRLPLAPPWLPRQTVAARGPAALAAGRVWVPATRVWRPAEVCRLDKCVVLPRYRGPFWLAAASFCSHASFVVCSRSQKQVGRSVGDGGGWGRGGGRHARLRWRQQPASR